ncbi:MAG: ankyrin repeat domain-containing protein [Planctomycetota bacterium]
MSLLPWLLARGVCPDQRDESEGTLLMSAAADNDVETAALLLAYGADPTARNTSGETPFSYACANGSFESARLLHAAGTELNSIDTGGGTPLDWAKYYASKRFYDWLVSIGCEHRDADPRHTPRR